MAEVLFQHFIRSGAKTLRCGYTTGTCAALAAAAATRLLLTGHAPATETLLTPAGLEVTAPVQALPMSSSQLRARLANGEECEAELPEEVLRHANVAGSTAAIIKYALEHDEPCIIGTEKSICDYLSLKKPNQAFYLLSKNLICPDMRITTLLDVKKALEGTGGREIALDETLRLKAKHAIDEMIRLG